MAVVNAIEASPHDSRGGVIDAIRHSPFGVFIVDTEFRLVHFSAQTDSCHIPALVGADFGKVAKVLWREPFASEAIRRVRHCLATGEPFHAAANMEQRIEGQPEHHDWHLERLTFPNGGVGVACQFYDLRDRRQMEEVLRRSEQRFRLALDAASAMLYEADIGAARSATYGLERVTGYRAEDEDLSLDWWYSLIHPDDLPAYRESISRHLATGGSDTRVYRIRRKDGTWIWVESTGQMLDDGSGGPARLVGTLVDITERKSATDALRESEQRLRTLHALSGRLLAACQLVPALDDVLDCAMASCGAAQGAVLLFNPKLQALEIVVQRGLPQRFLDHFRAIRAAEGSATARALAQGQQFMIEDVELDAEYTPYRTVAAETGYRAILCTPLKTHDGTVVGILSTMFRDPHRVPDQDCQLLEIYARHAADFISRLRFEQALRDAERNKDEFLAMLAHELRGPLAPLTHALELARIAYGKGNALQVQSAHATMGRQLGQLKRLVEDLLDVSRIASQKLELRMEDLELASVARQAIEACRPLIERRSQKLSIELPAEPVRLRADPVRLTQVLCNLITNASKYTDIGGAIRLTAEPEGADIKVSIIDSGCGIPPELLPRVFDLFMQVDDNAIRSGGGLGIGLPLVRRLVEMHSGTVTAQSEGLGRGARFVVRLPRTAESR